MPWHTELVADGDRLGVHRNAHLLAARLLAADGQHRARHLCAVAWLVIVDQLQARRTRGTHLSQARVREEERSENKFNEASTYLVIF